TAQTMNGIRNQFLARSRLAADQDRRVGRRDHLELRQHTAQRRAAPDDALADHVSRRYVVESDDVECRLVVPALDDRYPKRREITYRHRCFHDDHPLFRRDILKTTTAADNPTLVLPDIDALPAELGFTCTGELLKSCCRTLTSEWSRYRSE